MKKVWAYYFLIALAFNGNIYSGDKKSEVARASIPRTVLFTFNKVPVYNGGYGSSMAVDPEDSTCFYILTDRGPCVNSASDIYTKIFIVPSYTPQIGKFKFENGSFRLISTIKLKDEKGNNLSGLPHELSFEEGDTLLTDVYGFKLEADTLGIDPEGLVVLPDKSFWICDEYGPDLVHFDSAGKTIERITTTNTGRNKYLPKVFARREPNGGMEGLTITPDGKTLVGIMQSPLFNPSKVDVNNSKVTRLLFFNTITGETKQYVYLLEKTNTNVSEIAAITDTTFLVLERDSDFLYGIPGALYKSVYKINISEARDISDSSNGTYGYLFNKGKTVEMLEDESNLIDKKIYPVKKTLLFNLADSGYIHDKPEALAIIDNHTIAICNDDDFGIESGDKNIIAAKKVSTESGIKIVDYNEVLFVKLDKPLINPVTSIDENSASLPFRFYLEQNYPNPFNPLTTIEYSISEASLSGAVKENVSLSIYDILGREITVLVNELQTSGNHSIKFNAGNLPSGIYFYKLRSGEFTKTRKMILMK